MSEASNRNQEQQSQPVAAAAAIADAEVSETINAALDQLHLDDLEGPTSTGPVVALGDSVDPIKVSADNYPTGPSGMFHPPPQLMGVGFVPPHHYPHMMHLPHHTGFFHAPGSADAGMFGAPNVNESNHNNEFMPPTGAPMFSSPHPQPVPNGLDINLPAAEPLWTSSDPTTATAVAAASTAAPGAPLASGQQDYKFIRGSSFAVADDNAVAVDDASFDEAAAPASSTSRRQTFHAISNTDLLSATSAADRAQGISLEKSESLDSPTKGDEKSGKGSNGEQAQSMAYAAAYPYGGPLLQPNPVLSGHPPPGSAQAYGIPSPFPGYGFTSPFQSFSPIPGTPLTNQPVNMPPPPHLQSQVGASAAGIEGLENSGIDPTSTAGMNGGAPPGAGAPAPWMYGSHPFAPMVHHHVSPAHPHQMMNRGNSSQNHQGNRRHHNNRGGNSNHGQRSYHHRKGEDASKYADAKLEDYIGNIYSLCKDQHGCRFLQKQLDIKGDEAATAIFEETKQYAVELMTDSFGNYLIQKLLERVSDEQRIILVKSTSPEFVYISLDPHGTRALQKLVECIGTEEEAAIIVQSLKNSIVELSRDLNGNHVVQKCLQKLNPQDSQFIFDAACRECVKIATHRHGCCVLQRCLDHGDKEQRRQLCEKVIANVDELTIDPFGNYVVQYILTKESEGTDSEYTNKIVNLLRPRVIELSLHKFGSNVIEKVLRTPVVSEITITELLNRGGESGIEQLLHDGFGNYVLQTALDIAHESNKYLYQRLYDILKPLLVGPVRNTPHGRRIMAILQIE